MRSSKWLVCDICGKDAYGASGQKVVEVCDPCWAANPPQYFYTPGIAQNLTASGTLARVKEAERLLGNFDKFYPAVKPVVFDTGWSAYVEEIRRQFAAGTARAIERAIIGSMEV